MLHFYLSKGAEGSGNHSVVGMDKWMFLSPLLTLTDSIVLL